MAIAGPPPAVVIVVTWMDGLQETYTCDGWEVSDGLLWLKSSSWGKCIPLVSVRIWTMGG
jgi:hypothetical protein